MMENTWLGNKLCYLVSGLFAGITGILTILSVFLHCETNLYDYNQTKVLTDHTPYLYCGLAVMGIIAVAVLCILWEHGVHNTERGWKITRIMFFCCGMVILAGGVFWIFFNDCAPAHDQKVVYEEARRIAGALKEPFDTGYFSFFPRNRGVTLVAALAIRIFGDHLYSFQIINLAAALAAYGCICKMTDLIFENPVISAITSFLLTLFYPLVIYTSYFYGTLLSVTFVSLGLYAAAAFCKTERLRYAVVMILAFPAGIVMHQSAAIGLVAAIIYLIFKNGKKCFLKNAAISVAAVCAVLGMTWMVDLTYTGITGAERDTASVPPICTIYMGLTSTSGASGPGSQDGSDAELFLQNGQDSKAAGQDAAHRIAVVLGEYATGKRDPKFFLEKAEYQWLDPTLGARKIIRLNDVNEGAPPNSDRFMKFYDSPLRSIIFKLSIAAMLLIYTGALIMGMKTICHIKEYPVMILIQLYVIGGFLFQLMWETLSRYCLGYFLWLIPQAAAGLYFLYRFFIGKWQKRRKVQA